MDRATRMQRSQRARARRQAKKAIVVERLQNFYDRVRRLRKKHV